MIDNMKQMYQLQKEARDMQKELQDTEIEAKSLNGLVTVVVNGEMKVEEVSIDVSLFDPAKKHEVERLLKDTLREAMHKAQGIAAEKSKAMMKAMNMDIPGL